MEYIVSARKYRPMTFASVVGQEALTATLKNAVKNKKLAHAFLFCGPRGVGKTTCARIFAKTINCEHITPDGEACNECESCRAFNEQRSLNIFELDAASNNSVENIKLLMEQTHVPPVLGKYKVFIIDEVHMLSTAAFNAFLKTLEEPPSYVIFILATTEKHKILPTIISRCQIYDFERMDVPKIVGHLKMVAQKEGIQYEEEALSVIAEKADGGMRDALSIFDQCASYSQGNLTYEKVLENLNVLDSDYFFRIVDLCLENKVSETMVLLNDIISRGFDGGHLINGLAKHLRSVMMASDPRTLPLLEVSERQRQRFAEQAKKCPVKFLYHALRFCNQCDISYRQSNNKRLLVELTLIEIGQITQEETPPGGRRPTKRLKSLFHQLVANSQQRATASQVAATKLPTQKVSQPEPKPQTTVSVPVSNGTTASAPAPTPDTPHRKTGGIFSGTFKSLLNTGQQKTNTTEPEIINKEEKKQFTQEDLLKEWFAMCNRMPQSMAGIAARLKHVTPKIVDYSNIELVVDNQMLLDQIESIKGRIRKTMALSLHNGNINFTIRLAEAGEIKPILSKREVFEKMRKNNSAIEQLRTILDLEMA
ncbi:MAG: DNA polymerase III subunit gamma/tau [Prevotella sp.]|nr:DNA polymerase III subunit gamma/tau [Prevotella sp.]